MIIEFADECWKKDDDNWKRDLLRVLVILEKHEQHALLADTQMMLTWCHNNLNLYVDYFRTRLASAQSRSNALKIVVSPDGAPDVVGDPPWTISGSAVFDLVNRPLRLVLENDQSDRKFVESTVSSFSGWCQKGWIVPAMGGGSTMEKDIAGSSIDTVARWRTFYLFDSDRLHPKELDVDWRPPGGDGCQGYQFETACKMLPDQRWHRLNRRSIENYLPSTVLNAVNQTATSALFDTSVGTMAHFYNLKKGLAGDGVSPQDSNKVVRASRSDGFWTSLPQALITALENGFGSKIADEFMNISSSHLWPSDVITEMNALADALQDAM
ncbi:hypothetical protein ACG97_11310 [Vogesella sp. EB]|uniref:hypothetical protein n=1 Tax=Vogesella sp. EB TaxID=1526735 RepID=UPI00064D2CB6|nr:hypothetical protein [Vogesella sp. EB]KMJ52851.1 hypothetical protein ACG97_11310 [Vogesella sp. EB]